MLDILEKLGLTHLQAKTYLALTQLEKAEVRRISKATGIARQDIYRIMPSLEKLGLAEKIVATPILYSALPLTEGTRKLYEQKNAEHTQLKASLKLLAKNKEKNENKTLPYTETEFLITSERKRFVKKFETAFSEASTVDIIFPPVALTFIMYSFFDCFTRAISRGVRFRVITQKTEVNPAILRKLRALCANPLFELKFISSTIDFAITIFNDKEVDVCISSEAAVPSLWTNNVQVLKMARIFFENHWNTQEKSLLQT